MTSKSFVRKPRPKLRRIIKESLDRQQSRWLLSLVASLYSIPKRHEFAKIYYEDGVWVHKYRHGVIVDRKINYKHSLARYKATTIDNWGFVYKPKPGDVVFDIGAGIGTETYYFSKSVGPNGKVVSIEAHPQTYLCLNKFCKYNKLDNVTLLNVAIGESKSEVLIDDVEQHISSTIINTESGIKIKCTTLDLLIDQLGLSNIDFLKMNIEGAEKMAIKGMSKALERTKCLCIECHDFKADRDGIEDMRTKEKIKNFLINEGFKYIDRSDNRPWIRDQINGIRATTNEE